jgi:recombinational DNA repair ATPase RecF
LRAKSGLHQVNTEPESDDASAVSVADPRLTSAAWANSQSEWIRHIVRKVIGSGRALSDDDIDMAYNLFRQEKGLDERVLPKEPPLSVDPSTESAEAPLTIVRLSEVHGVNALVPGAIIEPHEGLTILYGENGTGKTGYSRIFKALAGSRTADTQILADVNQASPEEQTAVVDYRLGTTEAQLEWKGQIGLAPFTRMSIFDSPSVNFHVDAELEYVYQPMALALFEHISAALRGVQVLIADSIKMLASGSSSIVSRIPRESSLYPLIETLGASTDLAALEARADLAPNADERVQAQQRVVAALDANAVGSELALRQRSERVLLQAAAAATAFQAFAADEYDALLARKQELEVDYAVFRSALFAAADLPAEPDETWNDFVRAGDEYRRHLEQLGAHDDEVCDYCRQPLLRPAAELILKYRDYLADKISVDIESTNTRIAAQRNALNVPTGEVEALLDQVAGEDRLPEIYADLRVVTAVASAVAASVDAGAPVAGDLKAIDAKLLRRIDEALQTTRDEISTLQDQIRDRDEALRVNKEGLAELTANVELGRALGQVKVQVENAKEADRLGALAKLLPPVLRAITEQAKAASEALINQSFDQLFAEESAALRAPLLKVEFVGRQGRAQRKKTIEKHKPSRVLSEGEQKVLAMADFLAEARLAGITGPVLFDDPVSSLDHRRINEVAERIVLLAATNQVIVLTHDIFFATKLLALSEATKRCVYFQITDEGGKGQVTRATGPRWDTIKYFSANINRTIQDAKSKQGEERAALVREGFDWIRSWCEVFTEVELLQGVSQRYQPNIRMGSLTKIKAEALPEAIEVVNRVFEDACRFIPGHSQPLASLSVAPTLQGLEDRWQELQGARANWEKA